ncbi:MAG: glycogen debranching protein [Cyanobacteria bacterium P01_D01_bin.128]
MAKTIWVNEQIDPCGILQACIACTSEAHAQACYVSFEQDLSDEQREAGWIVRLRTVDSWEQVPVNALKLA